MRTHKLLTLLCAALVNLFILGQVQAQKDVQPEDPKVLIEKGMQAFQSHQYEQATTCFRQARRIDNESHKLSADDRSNLDRMLDEAAKGATNYRLAEESMAQGKRAMENSDFASARKCYSRVLSVGRYVPKAWVQDAKAQLNVIAEKMPKSPAGAKVADGEKKTGDVVVKKTTKTVRDQSSCKTTAGSTEVCDTKVVRSNGEARQPSQPTLLDEILAARRVQKEQALASYREAERRVRQAVMEHHYLAARDILRQARQDILRSRRLFTQEEAERILLQIDSLAKFIDSEEQGYQQRQVLLQMKEAEAKKLQREQQILDEKFVKIKEIFACAIQLRRERRYEDAIDKARQVLLIDPNNERAKWFIEDLTDMAEFARQQDLKEKIHREGQQSLTDAKAAGIPWSEEVTYPKNWQEMTQNRAKLMVRMGKTLPGDAPAAVTEKKLRQIIPDTQMFKGTNLRKAFAIFQNQGVNIFVRWDVLETENVTPEDEVKFQSLEGFKDISLRTALEILVKTMGTPEAGINYAIDTDGLVIISTRDNLRDSGLKARLGQLETRVYDISDLMYPMKRKTADIELQEPTSGGGSSGDSSLGDEDEDEDEEDEDENKGGKSETVVDLVLTLVRPETWSPQMENSLGQGEGTIDIWKRHWLIIYQTPEVHSEVDQFLAKLRESQCVQISLEARFVTVSSNFLEKIGLDLDVVLNQGHAGYDYSGVTNTFNDPRLAGIGPGILQPREFSYLGNIGNGYPLSPISGAGAVPPGWAQPYGSQGLVPYGGNVGPRSSLMTPVPIVQGSNNLVSPQDTGVGGSLASSFSKPAFQVMGAFLDDLQVNFLLEATQMDKYSNVVQAPRVVIQNGTQGIIQVEQLQPFISDVRQIIGNNAGGANVQANYMTFGTRLNVRANTTDLRYVNMLVEPRVTSPAPSLNLSISVPTVAGGSTTNANNNAISQGGVGYTQVVIPGSQVQQVVTQVSVPDSGTVLIGGLKQSGEVEVEAGPPVLNKIPVLKRFFSNKATTKDNFTLLVLVKPKIIIREETEPDACGIPAFRGAEE